MRGVLTAVLPGVLAVTLALCVGAVLVLLMGQSPIDVAMRALESTLLTGYGQGQVLFKATPLILTGLAVAVPYAAGLFNIGGEGQLIFGGLACAVVTQAFLGVGEGVAAFAGVVMASLAGGAAGAAVGALKTWRGIHEVISTIMFNFILTAFCGYLLHAHLEDAGTSHTAELPAGALFTRLSTVIGDWNGSLVSTSLLLALVFTALAQVLMFKTVLGFRLRASGEGALAARHAGVSPDVMIVGSLAIGGALAGLAGAHFVLGARRFFEDGLSGGEGFLGIAVALMARGQMWAVIPGAIVFGAISQAGLSLGSDVPREMVLVLQALVVLALAASGQKRGSA